MILVFFFFLGTLPSKGVETRETLPIYKGEKYAHVGREQKD